MVALACDAVARPPRGRAPPPPDAAADAARPARAPRRGAGIRPKDAYPVRYGPGTVFLSNDDYAIDWESLKFVVADHAYPTPVRRRGRARPRRAQGLLRRVRAPRRARARSSPSSRRPRTSPSSSARRRPTGSDGADWHVRRPPSAPSAGEAELHVMGASWSHALHPPDDVGAVRGRRRSASGSTRWRTSSAKRAALDRVTADASSSKLNVEGEECGIVLGTAAEAWSAVNELFVEYHPWATVHRRRADRAPARRRACARLRATSSPCSASSRRDQA